MKLYMFRTVRLSIIKSLFTLHSAMALSYRLVDSCLQTYMTYTIAECKVNKHLMMDRRTVRNMWNFMTK